VPARGDGVYSEAATVLTTSAVSPMTISLFGAYIETKAIITVEGGSIRWRITGNPTAQLGHIAYVGDTIILDSEYDIHNFLAVLNAGTSGATIFHSIWGR
ncbi:hypothetical protein LCGC14_2816090, partial [marine sediment metagenome]